MCLWLIATSPVHWALVTPALYGIWRWHPPQWVWLCAFANMAAFSLVVSHFVEARGALYDRIRVARMGRTVLAAAIAAVATLAMGLWTAISILLGYLA